MYEKFLKFQNDLNEEKKYKAYQKLFVSIKRHCVKSVRIWSFSVRMWENMDQKNPEYGHFSRKAKVKGTQPTFTCSKLTIEALEQGVKYVQR